MTLVMWYVWPRRGPYEPEFEGLSRDSPGSRQNRDKIGPEPRDLAAAHWPVREFVGGARSTATGPDPGDLDRCLGAYRTWLSEQVACRCASRRPCFASEPVELGGHKLVSGTRRAATDRRCTRGSEPVHCGDVRRPGRPRRRVPLSQL